MGLFRVLVACAVSVEVGFAGKRTFASLSLLIEISRAWLFFFGGLYKYIYPCMCMYETVVLLEERYIYRGSDEKK